MDQPGRLLRPLLGSMGLHLVVLASLALLPLVLWWRSEPAAPPVLEFQPQLEAQLYLEHTPDAPEVEVIPPEPATAQAVVVPLEPDPFERVEELPQSPLQAWPNRSSLLQDPEFYRALPAHPSGQRRSLLPRDGELLPVPGLADPLADAASAEPAAQNPAVEPSSTASQDQAAMDRRLPQRIPAYCPPPPYPRLALRRGIEGRVRVRVRVGTDGRVLWVRLEQSSGSVLLDQAALEGVRHWRFQPARRAGHAVIAEAVIPLRFHRQRGS